MPKQGIQAIKKFIIMKDFVSEGVAVGDVKVVVKDMNQEGLPDIIVANQKGVFIFERINR